VFLGLAVVAVAILVGWALHATASVSALIVAAAFTAVAMAPLHRKVGEAAGRRWVGHLVVLALMIAAVAAFAGGLFFVAWRVAAEFPAMSSVPAPSEMIPGMGGSGGAGPGLGRPGADGPGGLLDAAREQIASRLGQFASTAAFTVLQFATAALGGLTITIFLALIMLIDGPNWRARLRRLWGEGTAATVADGIDATSRQLGRFLAARAALGVLTAVLYTLWLWPFGVGLLWVWAVLTVLLSFVPNFGSIISGLLPTIYAFLTRDLGTALLVAGGLLVIEQVIGNYVDPRVQGRQVSLAPAVILSALLVFAWIWGVPGALLSTPILIAMVVGFARIEPLRPAALLISDTSSFEELDRIVRR
jgi:AI-2 transport protein TqsA